MRQENAVRASNERSRKLVSGPRRDSPKLGPDEEWSVSRTVRPRRRTASTTRPPSSRGSRGGPSRARRAALLLLVPVTHEAYRTCAEKNNTDDEERESRETTEGKAATSSIVDLRLTPRLDIAVVEVTASNVRVASLDVAVRCMTSVLPFGRVVACHGPSP